MCLWLLFVGGLFAAAEDAKQLEGTWQIISAQRNGQDAPKIKEHQSATTAIAAQPSLPAIEEFAAERTNESDQVFLALARRAALIDSDGLTLLPSADPGPESVWLSDWADLLTLPVTLLEEVLALA
jgi:hypothetical protein